MMFTEEEGTTYMNDLIGGGVTGMGGEYVQADDDEIEETIEVVVDALSLASGITLERRGLSNLRVLLALDRAAFVLIHGDDSAPGQLLCQILVGHAWGTSPSAPPCAASSSPPMPSLVASWPGVVAGRARGSEAEAGRERDMRRRREGVLWA
jgi:hypothetical protein